MAALSSERERYVAEVANRLRMLQINCPGQTAQERQAFLGDVIEKALQGIVPAERAAFLEALQARFPAWDGRTQPAAAPESTTPSKDPKTVEESFNEFLKLAPTITPAGKQIVVDKLRQAGFPVSSGGGGATPGLPDDVGKWLREVFKFPATQRVDVNRLLTSLPVLLELASGLHQFVWMTWRTLAPNSEIRPNLVNLQSAIIRYLAGETSVTAEQLGKEMTKLRQLTAALVAAIGDTSRQFASRHCAKFSPTEIEAVVNMEGKGGIFGNFERRCWQKYKELFGENPEDALETDIRETISRHVELLMKGLAR